ncbi:MAG: hypothetical protein RLZZ11_377 [Cyanobacteriota bacterium]|jgi:hypothetical protein
MARFRLARTIAAVLLSAGGLGLTPMAEAAETISGPAAKGAQVYCFMRNSGNNHEVSWIAAYALIKRQSASLFKTSPEHAAVMITEAVVQNPGTFPDCGKYLGDLYASAAQEQKQNSEASRNAGSSAEGAGTTRTERYAY